MPCTTCGGGNKSVKKMGTPSGKNAPNPFQKSSSVKIGKSTSFGTPKIRTSFKIK